MPEYLSLFFDQYTALVRQHLPKGAKWSATIHSDGSVVFDLEAFGGRRFGMAFDKTDVCISTLRLKLLLIAKQLEKESKEANNDQA